MNASQTTDPAVIRKLATDPDQSSDSRAALAGWYLRPRFGAVTLFPLLAGLAVCMLLALLRGAGEDPRANLRESSEALLALAPADVPPAENAALDYAKLGSVYAYYKTFDKNGNLGELVEKDSQKFEDAKVKKYLQANALARTMLLAATQKPRCNFGLNYRMGWSVPLPQLGATREYARFLSADARARAHSGDHAGAAADIEAMYKLADHTASDPFLLCGLVALAVEGTADTCIQNIMIWDTPTQAADVELYRHAHRVERHAKDTCVRCIGAEKALGLYAIDHFATGAASPSRVLPGVFQRADLYAAFGYASDRHRMIAIMNRSLKYAETGELHGNDSVDKDNTQLNGPSIMTNDLVTSARSCRSFWSGELQARATDAGLAVLLYRIKNQRDPASLDELVPEFLSRTPEHPVSHQPLKLENAPLDKGPAGMDGQPRRPQLINHFNGREVLFIRTPGDQDGTVIEFIVPPLHTPADVKTDGDF